MEMNAVPISVLDQSFARSGNEAAQALQETLQMAQHCEQLGYRRFWVSEHHAFAAVAGSAPEVLLAALGGVTKTIRLGSGGVMLPHYSPYKVAEQFSLLANLYPRRIDLGIGRAPGGDMETAMALAPDGKPHFHEFPHQVEALINYLRNDKAKPLVSPKPPAELPVWMLGSSADSAHLAAQHGLRYTLGAFINPAASPSLIAAYKSHFVPGEQLPAPYAMLAIGAFCADSEAQARALQRTYDVNFFRFVTGQSNGTFLPPHEAMNVPVSAALQGFMNQREALRAIGTPEQVHARLQELAKRYDVDEIMLVTNAYYFEDRLRSFELIKAAQSQDS
ncbi:MAG: LLM class flavin-dependent oxidoreductase [Pseudomonadales bacterium]